MYKEQNMYFSSYQIQNFYLVDESFQLDKASVDVWVESHRDHTGKRHNGTGLFLKMLVEKVSHYLQGCKLSLVSR